MNIILYVVALSFLAISFFKSREKTKKALKKSWKAFENILPEFLIVIMLVGFLLAVMDPKLISGILGSESGIIGVGLAASVGAVTMIPAFVAFPTAALLLEGGAGLMQIGAFVSSLMMVGVVTLPIEIKYFGKKISLLRNSLAFVFSFFVAVIIGVVVG